MSSYETCKMLALRGCHKKNFLFQNQPTYGHDAKQEQKMDFFFKYRYQKPEAAIK